MLRESEYHISNEVQNKEKLIIVLAKKDMKNFAPLYHKYYEQIFNYCYLRVNTKEDAFDITAQVFLKAMTNLYKYTFKGVPFTSWLYRIAMNELTNEFKKNQKIRTINISDNIIKDLSNEINEPENDNELKTQLIQSLRLLDENNLSIIEMRFFEKRSFKEIGEILDITENNAKVKLYRALDKLKKILKSNNLRK